MARLRKRVMRQCERSGCDNVFQTGGRAGKINKRFCSRRCALISCNTGRKLSESHKQRMSEARLGKPIPSLRGRTRSEEDRRKISEGQRGKHINVSEAGKAAQDAAKRTPEFRSKMSALKRGHKYNLGKRNSEQAKLNMSLAALRRKPRTAPLAPRSQESRDKMSVSRMKWNTPMRDTKPERLVQAHLYHIGLSFVKHKQIVEISDRVLRRHMFDILLSQFKIAIEVDGCYWHACSCCKRHVPGADIIKAKDALIVRVAKDVGWKVIRIWEHDIKLGNFEVLNLGEYNNVDTTTNCTVQSLCEAPAH